MVIGHNYIPYANATDDAEINCLTKFHGNKIMDDRQKKKSVA